ncbi:uncharacterized protein At1g01500 [Brachypodium distachyon]|uniref:Erythronate-4-phosphate dehydrogenase family protein n=1 Tax=Brachypodium distachyon TaxID=15368 RepID=I1H7S1_BRADI|nr:uncharacterized protein At1g01500 [Brachypodium distachyon]XP_010228927.1 uncharacterized protein At1g01500 [Brachypodium distachyon]KQK22733.1 hypothetical protein BRADI_1g69070v3 [Brachypodium distachyon]|eukprot:XP_003558428.1 uncharacterized protein At1g01500 [Brachypodium distachyon]
MGEIPEPEATKPTPEPSSWLSLRVFYLRLSKCEVNESMLDSLTVTHAPLTADTVLLQQANGGSNNGHVVTCSLRRDRVDRASREATFVSTEAVRMSGSARFEVRAGEDERLLVGIMEMCDVADDGCCNGGGRMKGWVMKCQVAATQRGSGFLTGNGGEGPTIEVYVASLFRGAPVVFTTKAMQLRSRRKRRAPKKVFMEPIPECADCEQADQDTMETPPDDQKHGPEESEYYYRCYKPDPDYDGGLYVRSAGMEEGEEDSELSWFTAGVRVGVGISMGICLGVGIGARLLARSYQLTSRSMRQRLISSVL